MKWKRYLHDTRALKRLDTETLRKSAKRLVSGEANPIGLYTPFETPIFRNYTYSKKITGIQDILYERGFDEELTFSYEHDQA